MARGRFYSYGLEEGESAAYDTDWQPGEMKRAYERDELGEIVSRILENWQQMAGTIYYQDATDTQLDAFEEGFYKGFERGVRKQLSRRRMKHPISGHYGPEGVGR